MTSPTRMTTAQKIKLGGDRFILLLLAPVALGCALGAGLLKGSRIALREVKIEASLWTASWRATADFRRKVGGNHG